MTDKRTLLINYFKRDKPVLLFLLILISTLYLPVFKNLFTNWDDELYIVNNPYLKNLSFSNIKSMFATNYAGNYHPFTMISLAFNYKLSGIHPWSYQLINLMLHLSNTALVYIFMKGLLKLKSPDSQYSFIPFVTAILFGIHTFQVESVAWMSERKNVLYAFFFFASLIMYLRYLDKKSWKIYVLSMLLFMLSLLSKGMAVSLSICLVLIDYFSGRKLTSKMVIMEKIPFLTLSLIFGYIAKAAQHSGTAIRFERGLSWFDQVTIAGYGFMQYVIKLIYPFRLSAFYPYPVKTGNILPYPYMLATFFSLAALFIMGWYARRNKTFMFGWLFFLANIVMVIQLLPVGDAIMADRYVYVASAGFFCMVAYLAHMIYQRSIKLRGWLLPFFIIYCLVIGVKTYHRIGVWKDSETLWEDALRNYPENNDRGMQNLGNVYFEKHNYNKALQYYNNILQIPAKNNKAISKAYIGKARVNQAIGNYQGAMQDFNTSLSYLESYDAYLDRSVLKNEMEDAHGALEDLDNASMLEPLSPGSYINRGGIYYQIGNYTDALLNFNKVLELDPNNSKAFIGIGQVKQALHEEPIAMNYFNMALSLSPSYEGYLTRAVLKIELKDYDGARSDLNKAYMFDSLSVELYINKGVAELNSGNASGSLKEFDKAVKLSHGSYQVYLYRGIAKNAVKDFHGAIADLNRSVQLHPTAEAYYYRGVSYMEISHKTDGCADLQQSAFMGNTVAQEEITKNCK